MKLPDYVSVDEVRRVCRELKFKDWTAMVEPDVSPEEAKVLLGLVNAENMNIPLEDFREGLEVELEHGIRFKDANVTNNHPILTAKIVLAHFKESLDYYKRLEVAELEGDLLKAFVGGDLKKAQRLYNKLARARLSLSQAEVNQVG